MVKQVANLDFVAKQEGNKLITANEEFEMTLERSKEVQDKLRERAKNNEIHAVYKNFEIIRVEEEAEEKPKKAAKTSKTGEDK